MKNTFVIIFSIVLLLLTFLFIEPITDTLASFVSDVPKVVAKESNEYKKDIDYLFVQRSDDYEPYSYQDLLNIYYSVINSGWDEFTFYCPNEYIRCISDISTISGDELILTHLNNYVHPFNSFTNVRTLINDNGEITLNITYLYDDKKIKLIDERVDEIIREIITDDMDDYDKLLTIHDYIINNTKYDVARNDSDESPYESNTAYGPLFQGYATCNGYTDLMAIFLTKLGFNNYKIATTPQEITESSAGHIWNALYYDGNWVHMDLTWDDPTPDPNQPEYADKDYLWHKYFLVSTEAMEEVDKGEVVVEEHNFNPLYYLEFN